MPDGSTGADSVRLRPMTSEDADAAIAVVEANRVQDAGGDGDRPSGMTDEQRSRMRAGMRRFVERDTDGAWVAVEGEHVVGMAQSIRRGGFWGLSMLFVEPALQSRGIGRRLLDRTLRYADGATVRMILSSSDPRALRRYAMAGHRLHPAVEAAGQVDRSAIPRRLGGRPGVPDDIGLVDVVDARLGRSRSEDVAFALSTGARMEVVDGTRRGFALHRDNRLMMLGATDDETAAVLLWRVLAVADGEAAVWNMTVEQHWAIAVALAAGLSVTPGGAIFAYGLDRLPDAWAPSGWYF